MNNLSTEVKDRYRPSTLRALVKARIVCGSDDDTGNTVIASVLRHVEHRMLVLKRKSVSAEWTVEDQRDAADILSLLSEVCNERERRYAEDMAQECNVLFSGDDRRTFHEIMSHFCTRLGDLARQYESRDLRDTVNPPPPPVVY